jgi:hypothetical protein
MTRRTFTSFVRLQCRLAHNFSQRQRNNVTMTDNVKQLAPTL